MFYEFYSKFVLYMYCILYIFASIAISDSSRVSIHNRLYLIFNCCNIRLNDKLDKILLFPLLGGCECFHLFLDPKLPMHLLLQLPQAI